MLNKKKGVFNAADEESFQMFAAYCGLALHCAQVMAKTCWIAIAISVSIVFVTQRDLTKTQP